MKTSRNFFARIIGYIFDYILTSVQRFFEYLVRNAYIIVAKDGTPLITSGKRAISLFKNHFENFVVLNQVGNVVLWIGKILVILIAAFVGNSLLPVKNLISLKNYWFKLIFFQDFVEKTSVTMILVLIAFVICHGFLTVFDMTLNTIFICFCDDCDQNDGVARPYAMSDRLKAVMRELKPAEVAV